MKLVSGWGQGSLLSFQGTLWVGGHEQTRDLPLGYISLQEALAVGLTFQTRQQAPVAL